MTWDYIIVGGGTAGCIVASRLSAQSGKKVLLLEAGADTPPGDVPPELLDSYSFRSAFDPAYQWDDMKVFMQPIPGNRGTMPEARHYEQARVIGGGSSINGQQANRGIPDDYDEWERAGAAGWSWVDVLPYYRKLERDLDFDGSLHGDDGLIPITRVPFNKWPGFSVAASRAFEAMGWTDIRDQNACFGDGWFAMSLSNDGTHRVSAATAYLDAQVRRRPNLAIRTNTQVRRLLLDGGRVTGVELETPSRAEVVSARETIVCAGALQTPEMLLRAGMGPANELRMLGVPVAADLAGVGRNLQDHPTISVSAYLPRHARLGNTTRRHIQLGLRYTSRLSDALPSDMYMVAVSKSAWHPVGRRLGSLVAWVNKPYSRGHVRLRRQNDGGIEREVAFELLRDRRDLGRLTDAARLMAELFANPALQEASSDAFASTFGRMARAVRHETVFNLLATLAPALLLDGPPPLRRALTSRVLAPGRALAELLADEDLLEEHVRRCVIGGWHASGTCRMGDPGDPGAVVDARTARVLGVEGLSVVDASLMPTVPRANTNLPTMMIAEKMADAILARP